jgi:hypothetical protein
MSMADFKIESKVRGLFIRFGIDMRHLDISVIKRVVYINGYATYDRSANPVLKKDIDTIVNEIKKNSEVRDVVLQLVEQPVIKKKPEERPIPPYLAKKKEQQPEEEPSSEEKEQTQ